MGDDIHSILHGTVLKKDYLIFFNNEQLRIARNSIYAFHGYIFKTKQLQDYFSSQYWYEPNPNFNESDFSEFDRQNIKNITDEENKRKK
jgi:hypothetical protein